MRFVERRQRFRQRFWTELNKNFSEISYLAKWDEYGALKGLWGAMSDESLSFKPWEGGYENGLYLAGVEAITTLHYENII